MMASLLIRLAYTIDDEGYAHPLGPDDPGGLWGRVRRDQVSTPFGDLDPDLVFPRTATDVIILGEAVSEEPVAETQVELAVGPYRQTLAVHGDRRWERRALGGLRPSPPATFLRMPLAWTRAHGGAAVGPYGPIPCPSNPRGRGYYLSDDQAVGQPLPNVEWIDAMVNGPLDQPEPAIIGPYPSSWWLRLQKVWTVGPQPTSITLHPDQGLFDQAHPRLSGKYVRAGDHIALRGMGPPLRTVVPRCPAAVEFILGDARCPRALELEEVLVDTTQRIIALAWRKCVQYEYLRHQRRITVLQKVRT
jgi:hypothetical protein